MAPAPVKEAPPAKEAAPTEDAGTAPKTALPPDPVKAPPDNVASQTRPLTKLQKAGRIIAWTAIGIAGGLAVAGIAGLGYEAHFASQWNDDARCLGNGMTRLVNCAADYSSANAAENRAVELFILGGAFATTAAVLLLSTQPEKVRPRAAPRVSLGPGPGLVGLAATGNF